MTLKEFFEKSWDRYVKLTPDALVIHQLLEERGEQIINDHVAYRTFNLPGIGRLDLGRVFEEWGYRRVEDDLFFPEKKLKASCFLHPDEKNPKVFISELLVEQVSEDLQNWIQQFTSQVKSGRSRISPEFFLEPSWAPVQYEDYQRFYQESEYASWTAAVGIQLNHFTVFFNSLKTFSSLQDLNTFLSLKGLQLNSQGGEIKGTPQECLEQSSTVAKKVPWEFSGGEMQSVMGCYYEFARRYPLPGSSKLFQGFIPASANKIFESTFDRARSVQVTRGQVKGQKGQAL